MIREVLLNNYKAFDEVNIPLKPLTILLGANSVGKSSIIQMLMLLHQTSEERGSYSSALKIYGRYVNVGAFENLFKMKKTDNPIRIRLTFSSRHLTTYLKRKRAGYVSDFKDLCTYFPLKALWELRDMEVNKRDDFKKFIKQFFDLIGKSGSKVYRPQMVHFLEDRLGVHEDEISKNNHTGILQVYDLFETMEKRDKDDNFIVEYEISLNSGKTHLFVSKLLVSMTKDVRLLQLNCSEDGKVLVSSDIVNLKSEDTSAIAGYFRTNTTIFDCIAKHNRKDLKTSSPLSFCLIDILQQFIEQISDCLSEYKINYVSPLRAHPKRYYMLDKAKMTISLDTLDGDAIAEVLKENRGVKDNVNNWLSKFGFEVNVKGFKEVIHHLNVSQNGLNLDITDVGFGISQVLPIIIQGFLSVENSITIVEQPEIHLHPMMQADLGDLFIDIIRSKDKKLLIETHSEYLLRRIRRRISEGVISSDMVAVCFFHPRTSEKDAWVETLEIDEKGGFTWPENFYGGELYNDTVEFLKNQN